MTLVVIIFIVLKKSTNFTDDCCCVLRYTSAFRVPRGYLLFFFNAEDVVMNELQEAQQISRFL